jgi:hypothetical protein
LRLLILIVSIEFMLVKSTNGSGHMVNIGNEGETLYANTVATDIGMIQENGGASKPLEKGVL